jgi:hypothetical protein
MTRYSILLILTLGLSGCSTFQLLDSNFTLRGRTLAVFSGLSDDTNLLAATLLTAGLPVWVVIPAVLAVGVLAGLVNGAFVRLGLPATAALPATSINNGYDTITWEKMVSIKQKILRIWDHAPPTVRICCIKFVQRVVLAQSVASGAEPRVGLVI